MIGDGGGIDFRAHLRELRNRLIVCAIAAAVGFGISYNYSDILYDILTAPLLPAMPPDQRFLIFTGVVEPFFVYMKVGFVGAVLFASPVMLYQAWAFIAPGLVRKEKLWFASLVISSLVLFISGVVFSYFVVFPFGFKYLMSFAGPQLRPLISMSDYFSMITKFLLAFGVTFQLPLVMLVLSRIGLVTARQLASWWRYAIVVILIIAAILTPTPDIFNQLLMAGPLILLYAVGIGAAFVFGKKKA